MGNGHLQQIDEIDALPPNTNLINSHAAIRLHLPNPSSMFPFAINPITVVIASPFFAPQTPKQNE